MKAKTKTTLTFSIDLESDKDILAWAEQQENLSASMRRVVREHIENSPRLGDLLEEIRELAAKMGGCNTS